MQKHDRASGWLIWLGCVWLLAAGVPAQALIIEPLSVDELSDAADVVVHGRVEEMSCERDAGHRIVTRVQVNVTEVWKGVVKGEEGRLEVYQAGGVLGKERLVVPGQSTFKLGEEVVLFLVKNAEGKPLVIGLCQGKFAVRGGEDGGEKKALNWVHDEGAHRWDVAGENEAAGVVLGLGELRKQVLRRVK